MTRNVSSGVMSCCVGKKPRQKSSHSGWNIVLWAEGGKAGSYKLNHSVATSITITSPALPIPILLPRVHRVRSPCYAMLLYSGFKEPTHYTSDPFLLRPIYARWGMGTPPPPPKLQVF